MERPFKTVTFLTAHRAGPTTGLVLPDSAECRTGLKPHCIVWGMRFANLQRLPPLPLQKHDLLENHSCWHPLGEQEDQFTRTLDKYNR